VKGVYVLIIQVDKDVDLNVGALGKLRFEKGVYAYVGSAQTNLEKRINRHFKKEKRKFWHIDYLLDNEAAKIAKVFFKQANKTKECEIAEVIGERGEPIAGFGCSDCKCKSHLFQLKDYEFLQETRRGFAEKHNTF
jgi:Uri superfamily endonuclease